MHCTPPLTVCSLALVLSSAALAQQSSPPQQELSCLQQGVAPKTAMDDTQAASGASMTTDTSTAGTSAVRGAAGRLSTPEVCFMDQAARSNLFELKSAQLALKQSKDAGVKAFAQTIIKDHTTAGERLKALAAAYGAKPPIQVSSTQQTLLNTLQTMRGLAFDLTYLAQQVSAHNEAVDLFSSYSKAAAAPSQAVRQFAAQTLPVLQRHVSLAQQVQRQVAKATSGASTP